MNDADLSIALRRYSEADFDELFATRDESEMRRHLGIGWLLLDERVESQDGADGAWIGTLLRRGAGRVLPAAADPSAAAPEGGTVYVLGHPKEG